MNTPTFAQAKALINRYGSQWHKHMSEVGQVPRFGGAPVATVTRPSNPVLTQPVYRSKKELSEEYLRRYVPSVFATEPWQAMSDKYKFIPTIKVINAMKQSGMIPVSAHQSNSRIPGKRDFTKHSIRFRVSEDLLEKDQVIPEIQLINSHDGTASYQLYLGLYRCVCNNQMTVKDKTVESIRIIHKGQGDLCREVIRASYRLSSQAHIIMNQIEGWQKTTLTEDQQLIFAERALELYDSSIEVSAQSILSLRRNADRGNDLWTVFNRVQENLMKGRIFGRNTNNRRVRTREVKSIDRRLKLNTGLWELAGSFAN